MAPLRGSAIDNASSLLFGICRFGADCVAVLWKCNAGAHFAWIVTTHHAVAPAPAPNMTSQVELQPKSAPDALAKIGHVARAARAEAPPKNNRVSQTLNYQVTPLLDRFSIKGY